MQYTLNKNTAGEIKIEFTITATEVDHQELVVINEVNQNRSFPGFRPGKASVEKIREVMGDKVVFETAIERLMKKALSEAIEQEDIIPAGQPWYEEGSVKKGEEVSFSVTLPLYPTVTTLPDPTTLTFSKQTTVVGEAEVEVLLGKLRESREEYSEAGAEVMTAVGQKITVDLEIKREGVMIPGGKTENYLVFTKYPENYLPGFIEKLLNHRLGEAVEFKLAFPADYANETLAGGEFDFLVNIKGIAVVSVPELTDDFAKKYGKTDLEALRTQISENLIAENAEAENNRQQQGVVELLVENSKFGPISELLINQEVNKMLAELKSWVNSKEVEFEDYLKREGVTVDKIKLDFTPRAIQRIKAGIVLGEIAKKQGLAGETDQKTWKLVIDYLVGVMVK